MSEKGGCITDSCDEKLILWSATIRPIPKMESLNTHREYETEGIGQMKRS